MRILRRVSRVAVVSRKKAQVSRLLKRHGFSVVSSAAAKPDVVVAFGGDGTILDAEKRFPGVPKLGVRNSQRCHLCEIRFAGKHAEELVCWSCLESGMDALKTGSFDVVTRDKVDAVFGGKTLTGLNEVQLHNPDPRRAIRFSVRVGKQVLVREAIGDGLLLASAFGAGGYFRAVSRQSFKKGFGLALNNPVDLAGPWFFSKSLPPIHVRVVRGPAWALADNDPRKLIVPSGGNMVFRRSLQPARFVVVR